MRTKHPPMAVRTCWLFKSDGGISLPRPSTPRTPDLKAKSHQVRVWVPGIHYAAPVKMQLWTSSTTHSSHVCDFWTERRWAWRRGVWGSERVRKRFKSIFSRNARAQCRKPSIYPACIIDDTASSTIDERTFPFNKKTKNKKSLKK